MSSVDPKVLIAEARKALEADWSVDRLDALHGQLKTHIGRRVGRLKDITSSGQWGSPGPERQKLVAAGDVDALRKLDDECRTIEAELEILRSLQGKLRSRLDEQRASEYAAGMPQSFAELDELLKAQAQAQALARKAGAAVESKLTEIRDQRHHVARHGQRLELAAAQPELLQRFMAVKGFAYKRTPMMTGWFTPAGNPGDPQALRATAELMGLPVPSPDRVAA